MRANLQMPTLCLPYSKHLCICQLGCSCQNLKAPATPWSIPSFDGSLIVLTASTKGTYNRIAFAIFYNEYVNTWNLSCQYMAILCNTRAAYDSWPTALQQRHLEQIRPHVDGGCHQQPAAALAPSSKSWSLRNSHRDQGLGLNSQDITRWHTDYLVLSAYGSSVRSRKHTRTNALN